MDINKCFDKIHFKSVETDSEALFMKIQQRILQDNISYIKTGVSRFWKYWAVAASVALFASFAMYFISEKKDETIPILEVMAISGSKTKIILPDSTIVWLNSNSTIRYPQKFISMTREVDIVGEVLFDVKRDVHKPFIVKSNGLKIQVLGTKFNVFSDYCSGVIETTLLSGSVSIYKENNDSSKSDLILKPDQQAIYRKSDNHIEVKNVHADSYQSWVSGIFIFEENTVEEIMCSLERAFNVKIHLENDKLKQVRLTAQFKERETLDEILSILQISAHYSYTKKKGEIYIK